MNSEDQQQHWIVVSGARENNLKNVDIRVPKLQFVVFTGVSGSGKSSLVFDTIYAEAHRQLLETWSAFSRTRLPKVDRPKIDAISGIAPAIVIDQKRLGANSRSTVGTVTELYGLLRMLFAKCGQPATNDPDLFSFNKPEGMCETCKGIGVELIVDEEQVVDYSKSLNKGAILHPDYKINGWFWKNITASEMFDMNIAIEDMSEQDVEKLLYSEKISIETDKKKTKEFGNFAHFEGVITGIKRRRLTRESSMANNASMSSAIDNSASVGEGSFSEKKIGREAHFFDFVQCSKCKGARLNEKALSIKIMEKSIANICDLELPELSQFLESIPKGPVSDPLTSKIRERLEVLIEIGVGYLTLSRSVATLSGGESQRVKMARQLGCDLVGMIYVLDEPTVGLHPRDIHKLVTILRTLRDKGNSVLVVEHEPSVILQADYIIDIGPKAGSHGGNVLFQGLVSDLLKSNIQSPTAIHLAPRPRINIPTRKKPEDFIYVQNANLHNLKNVSLNIPTSVFVCVTGVAGAGKSSLICGVFAKQCPKAIIIDQSPVGRSSRSNPATYSGAFDYIRKEFASQCSQSESLFSFNSSGACKNCKGLGTTSIDMHFLESVRVKCSDCNGRRFEESVLQFQIDGKSIADILEMTIEDAKLFFTNKNILKRLEVLEEVGLGYLTLGQSVSSLSGGEAQRLKLASELHKSGFVYIMDEPTTGLHMADINRLIEIIQKLVSRGNTVIVIEHNLDVALQSDWIIDVGPEGGNHGGEIVAQGTPEQVASVSRSHTARFLRDFVSPDHSPYLTPLDIHKTDEPKKEQISNPSARRTRKRSRVIIESSEEEEEEEFESSEEEEEEEEENSKLLRRTVRTANIRNKK